MVIEADEVTSGDRISAKVSLGLSEWTDDLTKELRQDAKSEVTAAVTLVGRRLSVTCICND